MGGGVVYVMFMLLFCMLFIMGSHASSSSALDCETGNEGCLQVKEADKVNKQSNFSNRKVLMGVKLDENNTTSTSSSSADNVAKNQQQRFGSVDGVELRNVPSGPDPLHHNRGSPARPFP